MPGSPYYKLYLFKMQAYKYINLTNTYLMGMGGHVDDDVVDDGAEVDREVEREAEVDREVEREAEVGWDTKHEAVAAHVGPVVVDAGQEVVEADVGQEATEVLVGLAEAVNADSDGASLPSLYSLISLVCVVT
ncbi:uncharacterized protein LOC144546487 isoform X2 [Carex rostrata]